MKGDILISDLLILPAIALPILYFIGFTKKSKAYKTFTIYLSFIAIIQIILFVYGILKIDNNFLFSYYFIGQFIFMSIFFYFLLKKRWIVVIGGFVLITLFFQYLFLPESFKNFNSFGVSVTQLIIVIYAILVYYKSLTKSTNFLYLNTGILIYFLPSSLFFASTNLLFELNLPVETHRMITNINHIFYLIFMLLIFLEWYRNYRPKKLGGKPEVM